MIFTHKIFVCFATFLAGIEASAPRLRPNQACETFGGSYCARVARFGGFILRDMRNWTDLATTALIDDRWRIVVPYVIKPKFSDKPANYWKTRSPGGGKPASAQAWIERVRPALKKAAEFYEPTNVIFREYSQADIDRGIFHEKRHVEVHTKEGVQNVETFVKQYVVISDFYDAFDSTGCTSDLGPNVFQGFIEIDIERCRTDRGIGSEYHPGIIAHEFMHVLGFLHEHQRPDRNQFLNVKIPTFGATDYEINRLGKIVTPYDPESITHYGKDSFIKVKDDHPESADMSLIGQREKLSKLDVEQINLNYPVPEDGCYNDSENVLVAKYDCGWYGVTEEECTAKGCCWWLGGNPDGEPMCFKKAKGAAKERICGDPERSVRKDCGWPGISREHCDERKCCWGQWNVPGQPRCYSTEPGDYIEKEGDDYAES